MGLSAPCVEVASIIFPIGAAEVGLVGDEEGDGPGPNAARGEYLPRFGARRVSSELPKLGSLAFRVSGLRKPDSLI